MEYKFAALLTPSLTFGDEFVWSEHANEATELLAACDGRRLHVNLQCSTWASFQCDVYHTKDAKESRGQFM